MGGEVVEEDGKWVGEESERRVGSGRWEVGFHGVIGGGGGGGGG